MENCINSIQLLWGPDESELLIKAEHTLEGKNYSELFIYLRVQ